MRPSTILSAVAVSLLGVSAFAQTPAAPSSASQAKPAAQAEAPPEPKYKVGDTVPDFTLKDQNRQDVTLSSFRGKKNVVLAFYIFAFTGG
jgi:cytochrome oxidase Cu insertion factor (SCO1/SenC/PrrC family)